MRLMFNPKNAVLYVNVQPFIAYPSCLPSKKKITQNLKLVPKSDWKVI